MYETNRSKGLRIVISLKYPNLNRARVFWKIYLTVVIYLSIDILRIYKRIKDNARIKYKTIFTIKITTILNGIVHVSAYHFILKN